MRAIRKARWRRYFSRFGRAIFGHVDPHRTVPHASPPIPSTPLFGSVRTVATWHRLEDRTGSDSGLGAVEALPSLLLLFSSRSILTRIDRSIQDRVRWRCCGVPCATFPAPPWWLGGAAIGEHWCRRTTSRRAMPLPKGSSHSPYRLCPPPPAAATAAAANPLQHRLVLCRTILCRYSELLTSALTVCRRLEGQGGPSTPSPGAATISGQQQQQQRFGEGGGGAGEPPRVALMCDPGPAYVSGSLAAWLHHGIAVPLCLSHPDRRAPAPAAAPAYRCRSRGRSPIVATVATSFLPSPRPAPPRPTSPLEHHRRELSYVLEDAEVSSILVSEGHAERMHALARVRRSRAVGGAVGGAVRWSGGGGSGNDCGCGAWPHACLPACQPARPPGFASPLIACCAPAVVAAAAAAGRRGACGGGAAGSGGAAATGRRRRRSCRAR